MPHPFHEVNEVGSPVFYQAFRFWPESFTNSATLLDEMNSPAMTYLTLFCPTFR